MDFASIARHPDYQTTPGVLVPRPDEPLFFANAESLRTSIRGSVGSADPGLRAIVIDLEMSGELDVPALDMLDELIDELQRQGIRLFLARVHMDTSTSFARSGLLSRLGADGVQPHVVEAVRAALGGE